MDPMSIITQFRFPNGLVHCEVQGVPNIRGQAPVSEGGDRF